VGGEGDVCGWVGEERWGGCQLLWLLLHSGAPSSVFTMPRARPASRIWEHNTEQTTYTTVLYHELIHFFLNTTVNVFPMLTYQRNVDLTKR